MTQANGTTIDLMAGQNQNESRPSAGNASALKKFVTKAETATSPAAVVDIIKQAVESPSIYVFGELLDVQAVKSLLGTPNEPYLNLLSVFAYGTYSEYRRQRLEQPATLPDLTPAMITKLRHLSIVSLARSRRHIPYAELLQELDVANIRQLEDMIIDVIYANVIKGTMDQKNSRLEVDQTIGRDVRSEQDFDTITNVLSEWCRNCDNILANIEHQMTTANRFKEESNVAKASLESKIANVKKNLKTTDSDDIVMSDVVYAQERIERMDKHNEGSRRSARLNSASSKFIKGIGGYKTPNKSWNRQRDN